MHYLESSRFILTKKAVKEAVSGEDRSILEMDELPDGYDFDCAFATLFDWCQAAFTRIESVKPRLYEEMERQNGR